MELTSWFGLEYICFNVWTCKIIAILKVQLLHDICLSELYKWEKIEKPALMSWKEFTETLLHHLTLYIFGQLKLKMDKPAKRVNVRIIRKPMLKFSQWSRTTVERRLERWVHEHVQWTFLLAIKTRYRPLHEKVDIHCMQRFFLSDPKLVQLTEHLLGSVGLDAQNQTFWQRLIRSAVDDTLIHRATPESKIQSNF